LKFLLVDAKLPSNFPVGLPPLKKTNLHKEKVPKRNPPPGGGSFLAVFGFLGKPTGKLQKLPQYQMICSMMLQINIKEVVILVLDMFFLGSSKQLH
jgi:hypothetical protein